MIKITSLVSPRIKNIVQLRKSRQRGVEGFTIVEGVREVERAFEAGVRMESVYFCGDRPSFLNNVSIYETTKDIFSKISYGKKENGVLAVCQPKQYDLKDFKNTKNDFFVVVEGVEKPGNLGAILRTCDGVGVTGVIVCDQKTDVYNPNVIRASLGTIFSVKTVVVSVQEVIGFLKVNTVKICAAFPEAKMVYTKADLTGALAVVVGSEDQGLSTVWSEEADMSVRIPMKGKADSLNVSVSTGVLLYEAFRQRG
ncbi:SpoU rRNA methylase family protein [hydrothermal vent metagenome]|uniref:SpoU rRNA methylase family protein n=1 Tax=hydrothermal vent metagenome TaxID=652676 RepID=A0A3B1DNL1_9ZZZZ